MGLVRSGTSTAQIILDKERLWRETLEFYFLAFPIWDDGVLVKPCLRKLSPSFSPSEKETPGSFFEPGVGGSVELTTIEWSESRWSNDSNCHSYQ